MYKKTMKLSYEEADWLAKSLDVATEGIANKQRINQRDADNRAKTAKKRDFKEKMEDFFLDVQIFFQTFGKKNSKSWIELEEEEAKLLKFYSPLRKQLAEACHDGNPSEVVIKLKKKEAKKILVQVKECIGYLLSMMDNYNQTDCVKYEHVLSMVFILDRLGQSSFANDCLERYLILNQEKAKETDSSPISVDHLANLYSQASSNHVWYAIDAIKKYKEKYQKD